MVLTTKTSTEFISIDAIKEFMLTIDYPNEWSGNLLKDDFRNAAHLILPDTDIFVLMFLIRAQKHGLQLAFVDAEEVRGMSFGALAHIGDSHISEFLLPGYADVFQDSFNDVRLSEDDTEAGFVLLGFVLNHFGKANDLLSSDAKVDNFGEILNFINGVKIEPERSDVDYFGILIKYWRPLLVMLALLIMYWLFDDLKEAAISLVCWIGLYFIYKTFKAIKDVCDGTTTW